MQEDKYVGAHFSYISNMYDLSDKQLGNIQKDVSKSDFDELINSIDDVDFSQSEQDKFYKIVKDGYISDEEIQNLSYKEVKKIKELIMEKDSSGEYFEASLINASYKANSLMASSLISSDEDFNKAVYEMVKNMDDNEQIVFTMSILTGTSNMSDSVAWDEKIDDRNFDFKRIHSNDMQKYLEDKIETLKKKLEGTLNPKEEEFYERVLGLYTTLNEQYGHEKAQSNQGLNQVLKNNIPNPLELLLRQEDKIKNNTN